MLAAISFDTLAFIALVVIAAFFRWISKEAEKAKRQSEQDRDSPAEPTRIQPREGTEEERIRRFLEALGQPTSSKPPPPIEKRTFAPKQKRVVIPGDRTILFPIPPLTTVPPPLPVEVQMPGPPPPIVESEAPKQPLLATLPKTPDLSLVTFPETQHRAVIYPEVTTLLSSERGLRDAIILREIFGPPRSLQTLEC